jgi:bacterioferritin
MLEKLMKQEPHLERHSKGKGPKHGPAVGHGKANGEAKHAPDSTGMSPLLTDKSLLRKMARKGIDDGAVTPDYTLDKETVIELLNGSLATELVCTLRYKRHYYVASGIKGRYVAAEFAQHAIEELAHADLIAERIMQLGGTPDFNPVGLADRSHAEYFAGTDLHDMIRENLVAERIAIESYRAFIQFLGDKDPTTRSMLESILAMEEEHADDLTDLLKD